MSEELTMLPVADIYPHPDNPRKEVGDVTELADSVKKRGILQNLTVMPGHWTNGEWSDEGYTTLIGHRRTAAARQAGIESAPCRIVTGLTKNEQISMMLEENMQRNDLTIYEQAESFQLMLDLGDTVESLSEKTGFAKSTIYHRLNLAKLDHDVIKEKEDDESFQLTLKDMYELEKIDDVGKRNEILKKANDSSHLRYEVERIVKETERQKVKEYIISKIKEMDIPEAKENIQWQSGYEQIQCIDLWNYQKAELEPVENIENVYYRENGSYIYICRKKDAAGKNEDNAAGESEEKKREKQIEEKGRRISEIEESIKNKLEEFVDMLAHEKIKVEDNLQDIKVLCHLCMDNGFETTDWDDICDVIDENYSDYEDEEDQEKRKRVQNMAKRLPITVLLIENLVRSLNWKTCWREWNCHLDINNAGRFLESINEVKRYGFALDEEEEQMLKGTHPLYEEINRLKGENA